LKFNGEFAKSFNIIIQMGAILSIPILFPREVINLTKLKNMNGPCLIHLVIAIFPILSIGFLCGDFIKGSLFNVSVVLSTLIIGGVLLISVEIFFKDSKKNYNGITKMDALIIGLFQCFALIPGFSRSAATIIGGRFKGLSSVDAAKFSFSIAIPILMIASIYEAITCPWTDYPSYYVIFLAIGFLLSFVSSLIFVFLFIKIIRTLGLIPFGIYRIVIAVLIFFIR
ncbi:MAG: undecaprenyl-diphosphate phosphatase, partial [Thermodesulfobacteriota bacterium]|nr:undecaprenyl-diphosphate phosphatase [Thermodesulfobacteriota bacterium]